MHTTTTASTNESETHNIPVVEEKSSSSAMYCVVLQLGDNKYWVAETRNPSAYLAFILQGEGPKWARHYEFIRSDDPIQIDGRGGSRDILDSMIEKYGADNVRGTLCPRGTFTKKKAPPKKKIQKVYILESFSDKNWRFVVASSLQRLSEKDILQLIPCYWNVTDSYFVRSSYRMKNVLDIDHEVERLMLQHGINSVRGGSYNTPKLSAAQYECLKQKVKYTQTLTNA